MDKCIQDQNNILRYLPFMIKDILASILKSVQFIMSMKMMYKPNHTMTRVMLDFGIS